MTGLENLLGLGPAPKRGPRRYAANPDQRFRGARVRGGATPVWDLAEDLVAGVKHVWKNNKNCNLCRWENL